MHASPTLASALVLFASAAVPHAEAAVATSSSTCPGNEIGDFLQRAPGADGWLARLRKLSARRSVTHLEAIGATRVKGDVLESVHGSVGPRAN